MKTEKINEHISKLEGMLFLLKFANYSLHEYKSTNKESAKSNAEACIKDYAEELTQFCKSISEHEKNI